MTDTSASDHATPFIAELQIYPRCVDSPRPSRSEKFRRLGLPRSDPCCSVKSGL